MLDKNRKNITIYSLISLKKSYYKSSSDFGMVTNHEDTVKNRYLTLLNKYLL
mgnify:CR=1 FL=1